MNLTNEEINELIVLLSTATHDASTMIRQSHDREEIAAYRSYQKDIARWLGRLTARSASAEQQASKPQQKQ